MRRLTCHRVPLLHILVISTISTAIFTTSVLSCLGANANLSVTQVFYSYILPSAPFLILTVIALTKKSLNFYGVIGSAIGAVIAVGTPCVLLWPYERNYYGGIEFGLAFLIFTMPLYLPIFMAIGCAIGKFFSAE